MTARTVVAAALSRAGLFARTSFGKGLGWLPDVDDGRDLTDEQALYGLALDDPRSSDWRPYGPPRADQGFTSECVGEATARALATMERIAGLPPVELSPRQPYYGGRRLSTPYDQKVVDHGVQPRDVMEYVRENGICTLGACPRSFAKINWRPTRTARREATARSGGMYFRVIGTGDKRGEAIRKLLGVGLIPEAGIRVTQSYQRAAGPDVIDYPAPDDAYAGLHYQAIDAHQIDEKYECLYFWENSWGAWRLDGGAWLTHRLVCSPLVSDVRVMVGHDYVQRLFDGSSDPKIAAWRRALANLTEAHLVA